MAAITVKQEGTGDIITFDTVAEVGSAAEFISSIEKVWGEGVLLKPSSTSAFTARTPKPFPHGIYTFRQKSDTGEPGDLKHILKQLMDAMQDNMTLARLVLRGQLRPVSSSASTKRQEEYRLQAIEYYYGSHADNSKIRCMVTGEEVDLKAITAGHIYRQGWPTGLLKVMGCRLYEPRNIILMQNQLEKRFDNWEWTIVPEGPDAFRIHVLSPHLLDPKGREQYVAGHAGKGTKWRDIDGTLLQLPMTARPARRLCGLHAMLAIQEAETKGWFDETHEAPKISEASWQSPTCDHLLMDKYLNDAKEANMHISDPDIHCL